MTTAPIPSHLNAPSADNVQVQPEARKIPEFNGRPRAVGLLLRVGRGVREEVGRAPMRAAASPCNQGLQGGRRQMCGAGSQEASFQMDGCQGPLCSGARAPDSLAAVGVGSVGFCAQWEPPTPPPGLMRFCVLGHACSKQRECARLQGASHPSPERLSGNPSDWVRRAR